MPKHNFDYDRAKKYIQEAAIVSFDIFDTMLVREFYQPKDVFKYIETKHQLLKFQKNRIFAEVKTRSDHPNKSDITHHEIYANLENANREIELDIEHRTCIANDEIKSLYRYALSCGKRVIAISDMYLEEEIIKSILEKNGYLEVERIYVSGKLNKRKSSGELYQHVIQDLDIEPQGMVHIGDNYDSDYLQAVKNKISGIYYKSFRDQLAGRSNNYLLEKLIKHNSPQASLLAGLYANTHFEKDKHKYWYHFGFEYGGILIYNFVNHIYDYCKANSISRIYFMARDGKVIKEVFDMLYGKDKSITTYYMLASRRLFFVSSIQKVDENILTSLVESDRGISYLEIIKKLGFDWLIERAKGHFEDIDRPIKYQSDREAIRQFFKLHEQDILIETAKERKNLLAYLNKISFLRDSSGLLVDIGWNCSSQKYLESILQEEIQAIYFGTNKSAYHHKYIHGYFINQGLPKKNNDIICSSASMAVLELLFIGDHESIIKIDDSLNPVFSKALDEESLRISIAPYIHGGIYDFVKKYDDILCKYNLKPEHSLNNIILFSLLVKPSLDDILQISKIPHNAGWGNSTYEPIIRNLGQTQIEFFKNILFGKTIENKVLWSKGRSRYQELLDQKHYKSIEKLSFVVSKMKQCHSYSFEICIKKIFQKLYALK